MLHWNSGAGRRGLVGKWGGCGEGNDDHIIHSPTSLSELWDLPSNRHVVHTAFDFFFLFLSQNNICIHWSQHNTTVHTVGETTFCFSQLQEAGRRGGEAGGGGVVVEEEGRRLRLRQAGDVSLRRGAFWLAGGAVGLVLEEQDPAKIEKGGDESRVPTSRQNRIFSPSGLKADAFAE